MIKGKESSSFIPSHEVFIFSKTPWDMKYTPDQFSLCPF
jgi:hypothetical protein